MYLLKRELKSNMRSLIIWVVIMVGAIGLSLSMFPSFAEQGAYVSELLDSFPEEMLAALNASQIDFSNPLDYLGYIYQYILLAAAIMAMILGVSTISKEEGEGTIEFLNAKPITRANIVTQKLMFILTQVLILGVFLVGSAYGLIQVVAEESVGFKPFVLVFVVTCLTELLFVAIGMLVSVFVTKTKRYMPIALGVVFGMYFLAMMAGISTDLEVLHYMTPFAFFEVGDILSSGTIEPSGIWITLILSTVLIASTYVLYDRKDFNS